MDAGYGGHARALAQCSWTTSGETRSVRWRNSWRCCGCKESSEGACCGGFGQWAGSGKAAALSFGQEEERGQAKDGVGSGFGLRQMKRDTSRTRGGEGGAWCTHGVPELSPVSHDHARADSKFQIDQIGLHNSTSKVWLTSYLHGDSTPNPLTSSESRSW
jgi:hypothetical protein